jgi:hypothetical protein
MCIDFFVLMRILQEVFAPVLTNRYWVVYPQATPKEWLLFNKEEEHEHTKSSNFY